MFGMVSHEKENEKNYDHGYLCAVAWLSLSCNIPVSRCVSQMNMLYKLHQVLLI